MCTITELYNLEKDKPLWPVTPYNEEGIRKESKADFLFDAMPVERSSS